jgi:hypothetical protein
LFRYKKFLRRLPMAAPSNPGAAVYTQGFGTAPLSNLGIVPVVSTTAPGVTNIKGPAGNYAIGQTWIDTATNAIYVLTSLTASGGVIQATWTAEGSATGAFAQITPDTGTSPVVPSAGNITIAGTANQILTTGGSATLTLSLIGPYTPATYTAHGVLVGEGTSSIAATAAGTTGQVLIGATGADPAFGALGVNSGLTVHGVVLAENNSAFVATTAGTNGQVFLGSTAADPAFGTLTTTTGLAFTTGAHSLAINVASGGFAVTPIAGASQAMVSQTTYIANDAALTTLTLPAASAVGDIINVIGSSLNTGGWTVTYGAGQIIWGPAGHSTATTGNAASAGAAAQTMSIMCTIANTTWVIYANSGTITLT